MLGVAPAAVGAAVVPSDLERHGSCSSSSRWDLELEKHVKNNRGKDKIMFHVPRCEHDHGRGVSCDRAHLTFGQGPTPRGPPARPAAA